MTPLFCSADVDRQPHPAPPRPLRLKKAVVHYKTPEAEPAPDRPRTVRVCRSGGRSGSGVLRPPRSRVHRSVPEAARSAPECPGVRRSVPD